MASVIWSDAAIEPIDAIVGYIELCDAAAARRTAERLFEADDGLRSFPDRGRPAGRECRRLSMARPYIIRNEMIGDRVTLPRIRQAARLSPPD